MSPCSVIPACFSVSSPFTVVLLSVDLPGLSPSLTLHLLLPQVQDLPVAPCPSVLSPLFAEEPSLAILFKIAATLLSVLFGLFMAHTTNWIYFCLSLPLAFTPIERVVRKQGSFFTLLTAGTLVYNTQEVFQTKEWRTTYSFHLMLITSDLMSLELSLGWIPNCILIIAFYSPSYSHPPQSCPLYYWSYLHL